MADKVVRLAQGFFLGHRRGALEDVIGVDDAAFEVGLCDDDLSLVERALDAGQDSGS